MRSALSGSIKNKPGRSGVPLTLIAPLRASALRSATALPPLQPGVTFNKARTIEKRFCPRPSLQQFQTRPSLRAKRSNPFQSRSSLRAADESPCEAIHFSIKQTVLAEMFPLPDCFVASLLVMTEVLLFILMTMLLSIHRNDGVVIIKNSSF